MNPSKISILASIVICGFLTTLLVLSESNKMSHPENDQSTAEKRALIIAGQIDENLVMLRDSIKSLSFNNYWQSSPVAEWGFWLNAQKAVDIYKAERTIKKLPQSLMNWFKPIRLKPGKTTTAMIRAMRDEGY